MRAEVHLAAVSLAVAPGAFPLILLFRLFRFSFSLPHP